MTRLELRVAVATGLAATVMLGLDRPIRRWMIVRADRWGRAGAEELEH